ncbi:MAG TPA: GGDEF domain-containing protein [Kineosporiaceae bacterium]|nr:GGDEF domain-containing protein [Kineosporiaceae bacterium]
MRELVGRGRWLRAAWSVYLVVGLALIGPYYLVPVLHVPSVVQVAIYSGITGSAGVCVLAGAARYRPAHRRIWWWVAAGQLASAVADVVFFAEHLVLGDDVFPSVADLFYLAEYPLMAVGLALLVRARTPEWDLPSALDAAIIAVSAALLSWMFLITPMAGAPGLTLAGRLVSAAYPIGDLLLVCVGARLMLGAALRVPAFYLLEGFLLVLLGVDTAYGIETILGVYHAGGHLDMFWMGSALLLGAAGLHPSMAQLTERSATPAPDATPARVAVLAVASLLAPAAELVQHARHAPLDVSLVAVVCMILFLLVLARMAGLVGTQRRMAITDGLTGLRTRRFFAQALATEAARVDRAGLRLGLLIVDVDHFKSVNDTYGHAGGDRVLVEVARRLQAIIRGGDVLARYGGEEFALLLPATGSDELSAVAERVRLAVGGAPIAVNSTTSISVTVSIGAAAVPDHARASDDLVLTADHALYAAKETGRNRVVVAPIMPGDPLRTSGTP